MRAVEISGIKNKTELIHTALKILIEKYSRERLIALGGTEQSLDAVQRRRNKSI
jgi:hypothetical protein